MANKIIGYILLFTGLIAIIYSPVNVYRIFTHEEQPVQFFNTQNSSLDLNALINSMAPKTGNPALKNLPTASIVNQSAINDGLNLTLHIVLMGLVASAGFKLASLGVMLLRTIEVKLLENPVPVTKKVVEGEVK